MKMIFRVYLRPEMGRICFQVFIKLSGTLIELLLPWMLSVVLDDLVPQGDIGLILRWGVLMVLCALLAWAGNATANRMSTRISRDITRRLRHDLFARTAYLSSAQEDAFTTPSLISRLSSDTYNMHQMVDRMMRLGVRAPILLVGGILVTLLLDPVLTLVLAATLPLLAIVVWQVSSRGVKMYTKTQQALDRMIRRAQESMAGIRVIQALSKSDFERGRYDEANRDVVRRERRAAMLMNVTSPVMNLLLNTGLTCVIIVGAYRVNAGLTDPGVIVAFMNYFTIILNALMMVSRLFVMYSKGVASGKRIAEVLESEQQMLPQDVARQKTGNCIEFDHVSFSYGKVRNNLTDIHFTLKKGETLGIIGPTGSGKSTIINLLLRFYDPDKGSIRIDGRDLRSIPHKELHTMFGVVFQNDFLYAGTIEENIDFGRNLAHENIEEAAQTAQAEFIAEREGRFEAELVPKGANLSGGQKQRMLLSRAMAGNPYILLLDDSSSALDYKTDAALRRALSRSFARTTKIIVAQRVSSIRTADKILVLEDGKEAGYGTHEELMRSCPSYREIAEAQMGEVS